MRCPGISQRRAGPNSAISYCRVYCWHAVTSVMSSAAGGSGAGGSSLGTAAKSMFDGKGFLEEKLKGIRRGHSVALVCLNTPRGVAPQPEHLCDATCIGASPTTC